MVTKRIILAIIEDIRMIEKNLKKIYNLNLLNNLTFRLRFYTSKHNTK